MTASQHGPLAIMRGTVRDRMAIIEPHARNRSVLDVGCVDARPGREDSAARLDRKEDLLFRSLAACCSGLVGVDIDAEGVSVLKERGHNVVCADASTMDLGRAFDVIVAGEVIEHVSDAHAFLTNLAAHMHEQSVLVVSTPNPFHAKQIRRIYRHGRPAVHEQHVAWYDPITLQAALRRAGLVAFEGWWVQPRGSLLKTWRRLLRAYFSHSFLLLARRTDQATPPE
jgi:2-polyprenyl-3-methyl-5-hydroxy-6-metoxy-1,4-benzoquinol methylase